MRYQLTINCDELGDLITIIVAIERLVNDETEGEVGMIAEQIYTFDPTADADTEG